MTAANNGGSAPNGSTPEDDDPFGYLYEDGQAAGATRPGGGQGRGGYGYPGPAQPGVPRTSYNQVRAVGERQYGHHQGAPHPGYGQQQYTQHQQQPYAQPNPQYAAPETYPGGGAPGHPGSGPDTVASGGGRGRGRGPNNKGLLIGALAVVAVVVAGIAVAVLSNENDKKNNTTDSQNSGNTGPSPSAEDPDNKPTEPKDGEDGEDSDKLPKQDAVTLKLGGAAESGTGIKGAEGTGGAYVTNFNQVGASVTWKAGIKEAGTYKLYIRYTIPMKDANATLSINGKPNSNAIRLHNFRGSTDPALENNWQTTWTQMKLQKGQNEIKISCETGNQCDVTLDWLEVRRG
ncbi:CBM35 domain-containing protein [Streptomyces tsukubensis]|uniref:CBM35 domain-containing protein n=1 Tax=Streptomyces tsukubensis TaxID=83656 RepID=UPI00368B13DB